MKYTCLFSLPRKLESTYASDYRQVVHVNNVCEHRHVNYVNILYTLYTPPCPSFVLYTNIYNVY